MEPSRVFARHFSTGRLEKIDKDVDHQPFDVQPGKNMTGPLSGENPSHSRDPTPQATRAAIQFGLELSLWILPASVFLALYVARFHGPQTAVWPHLHLLLLVALFLCAIRVGLCDLDQWPGRLLRGSFLLTYAIILFAVLIFYLVMLIGLASWGRVATWPMLQVYVHQWKDLLLALDMPVFIGPAALLTGLALAILIAFGINRHLLWPQSVRQMTGPALRWALTLLVATLLLLRVGATYYAHEERSGEPVMLMINPWLGTRGTQDNNSEGARVVDEAEARAAASYTPTVPSHRRNVFLIVGDALRGDRLPPLGYQRATTPYLTSLADAGRFALARRATAVCAESYCGLMGIARSKFVHQFSRFSITLHQVLRLHGYRLGLLLTGDHTNFYGLAEALGPADFYWDGLLSPGYVNDDRSLLAHVDEMDDWDGHPTAIQFHLMSSHGLGLRQEDFRQFAPARNYYTNSPFQLNPERTRLLTSNYYDNGILQFDAVARRLLTTLESKGYLQDAVVIITGDHGEMLGEQGIYAHAEGVFQPALDVPFMLLRFGYEGPDISTQAPLSQVDIAPTLLDELSFPIPSAWSGMSAHALGSRDFLYFQQGQMVGLFDYRNEENVWKFWKEFPSGGEYAFNHSVDPAEELNRAASIDASLRAEWLLRLLPLSSSVVQHPRDRFGWSGPAP